MKMNPIQEQRNAEVRRMEAEAAARNARAEAEPEGGAEAEPEGGAEAEPEGAE